MTLTEKEFSDTLQILTDFKENPRILCAFSGGCDSLGLLILLVRTLGAKNVFPVYVNHNLRSTQELVNEVEKNKLNCQLLGLQLIVETVDREKIRANSKLYGGIEASARYFRYELLEKQRVLNNCTYIATAHHFDDQLETVLMKIVNKGPVTSLRGISEQRGMIIRPLLEFRRKDIENYVSSKGFTWSTDSTNADNSFKRNNLRNVIIPQLNKELPDWESRVENIRKKAVSMCVGSFGIKERADIGYIKSLNRAQQILVLFSMWDTVVGTQLPQTLIDRVLNSLDSAFCKIGANGGIFCIHKGVLYLVKDRCNLDSEHINIPFNFGGVTYFPDGSCIKATKGGNSKDIRLDPTLFDGNVVLRYARVGDTIQLKDGKKKLMRLLQDLGVPPVLRHFVPVLEDEREVCAVFASKFGANNRICAKLRCSLAQDTLYSYIYDKGK